MNAKTLFAIGFILVPTVAAARAEGASVRVVNLPPVQPVTGEELRIAQDALALVLQRTYGALPVGLAPPEVEECEVTGLDNLVEFETVEALGGESGCALGTYARACAAAAARHRSRCAETCRHFDLQDGRSCRGNARPIIEPFSEERHCSFGTAYGVTVSCYAVGWCSCDP